MKQVVHVTDAVHRANPPFDLVDLVRRPDLTAKLHDPVDRVDVDRALRNVGGPEHLALHLPGERDVVVLLGGSPLGAREALRNAVALPRHVPCLAAHPPPGAPGLAHDLIPGRRPPCSPAIPIEEVRDQCADGAAEHKRPYSSPAHGFLPVSRSFCRPTRSGRGETAGLSQPGFACPIRIGQAWATTSSTSMLSNVTKSGLGRVGIIFAAARAASSLSKIRSENPCC